MILKRLIEYIKYQNWTAIVLEFLIVVVGVFLGIQLGNWNDARAAEARRDQIVQALVTDMEDSYHYVSSIVIPVIENGIAEWEMSFAKGETPAPFYFRIDGSDSPPDTWAVLQQMDVAGLFDPVTLFDLNMHYSEKKGVAAKYIRYVTFVEEEILPHEAGDPLYFYLPDGGELKPEFRTSMERLREWQGELRRINLWGAV